MKNIYSLLPHENLSISVESSPVWEIALGIAGYTHRKMRHTFEQDDIWLNLQSSMTVSLENNLKEIEKTNLWYGLLMLQNKLSSSTIHDFLKAMNALEPELFYEAILPYKNRTNEPLRINTANNYKKIGLFNRYAAIFEGHEYLRDYILALGQKKHCEITGLLYETFIEWHNIISQQETWERWIQALSFESRRNKFIDISKPVEEIERVTGGAKYLPEPSVWQVKLIPHISYRPWILELRSSDIKLFFYPLNEVALLEPGIPPKELVQGHKSLGDELRLKLLFQITKGPISLQDLSIQFNVSKTTLHHQLSLLKAAKFIRVDKGIYTANPLQIQSFSKRLSQYLGELYE